MELIERRVRTTESSSEREKERRALRKGLGWVHPSLLEIGR
jgi:hypothetical protein